MRQLKYFSPSSWAMYEKDRTEFYYRYLADNRPPRPPQTKPMAVGSAFDAYIKAFLVERLGIMTPEYERDTLFEAQVEPYNRDFARSAGEWCFRCYKDTGALAALMLELEIASTTPRFELTVEGRVGGIPFLGKPDCYFITDEGGHVIFDWKVNGYCSARAKSPSKWYVTCGGVMHKDCMPMRVKGLIIDGGHTMEMLNRDWATQIAIYGWVLGELVGSDYIAGIEQLACGGGGMVGQKIRVASIRNTVGRDFQINLYNKILAAWILLNNGHVFDDMSIEESRARCEVLDTVWGNYA